MSHSDSEVKKISKDIFRKQLHIDFKAKKKAKPVSWLKVKLAPYLENFKFIQAVNYNNTEEVRNLLEAGADPNATDEQLRSALHIAVSKGYAEIVELLLKYGADANKRDVIQNTPLHLAVCVRNFSIISMLTKANANVCCLNLHGKNPLDLASSRLQMLQRGWREGSIEGSQMRTEILNVADIIMAILRHKNKMELPEMQLLNMEIVKMSLNDNNRTDQIDETMSQMLSGIEKIKIS